MGDDRPEVLALLSIEAAASSFSCSSILSGKLAGFFFNFFRLRRKKKRKTRTEITAIPATMPPMRGPIKWSLVLTVVGFLTLLFSM